MTTKEIKEDPEAMSRIIGSMASGKFGKAAVWDLARDGHLMTKDQDQWGRRIVARATMLAVQAEIEREEARS